MLLAIGQSYKLYYSIGNINNKTIHIRGFVDGLVLYRYHVASTQSWVYVVTEEYWFNIREESLTLIK